MALALLVDHNREEVMHPALSNQTGWHQLLHSAMQLAGIPG